MNRKERVLRELARKEITTLVNFFCERYNYTYNRIAIKNQKTRLGSCSTKKNLNFNWQITKFPRAVKEYIIKHEIAHLVHQNHSKNFWEEVEMLDPNYRENHKWIRNHAHKYIKY